MDRRTFLLGFIGSIAATAGLAGHNTPAEARPIDPDPPATEPDLEPAVMSEDSNSAQAEYAQWGYGPRRRYWRRARRRYWRRRAYYGPRYYGPRYHYGPRYYYGGPYRRHWRRVRRRYWRRRYW
jgi:hypothetical protein